MKVSVLVPVYGVAQYIGACAASLFGQTYRDIEFIFVDDCSPDDSISVMKAVLKAYPDRENQVRILRHEANKGVGTARQTAFAHATGEAVMHADSDDILPKDAVELLVKAMQKGAYDIVTGAYATYENGTIGAIMAPPKLSRRRYLRLMLCQNLVKHHLWARLYRRAFLQEQHIGFATGIDYCEDYTVVTRAFLHAKYGHIDQMVYYYRTDNVASYTHQISRKNLVSMLKANAVVADFFRQNDRKKTYRMALDMGLINMYREAMKHGMQPEEIELYCPFRPSKLVNRLFLKMMKSGIPLQVSNVLYLVYRRIARSLGM